MVSSRAAFTSSASRHVARDGERPPAEFFDQARRVLNALFRDVGDHHAGALARERQRRGAADAAPCPGYKRNLSRVASVLIRCHVLLSTLLIVPSVVRSHALPKPKLLLNKSPDHSLGSGSTSSRISRAVRRKSIKLIATSKLTRATNRGESLIGIKRMINSALQPNISHRCLIYLPPSLLSAADCRSPGAQGGIMIVENSCTILQIWETGDAGTSEEAAMDLMNRPQSEREARRAQAGRDELAERVARAVGEDGAVEAPGGLRLLRQSSPTPKDHGVSSPAFCVIAQGSKEVLLGDDCYRYDADHYLITAAALPTATRITEASEERPYLGVVLGLDPALVGSVMVEAGHPAPAGAGRRAGLRREPAGRGPLGRRGASRRAPGLARR